VADRFHSLIQSLRAGSQDAFNQLYEATHKVVYFSILGIIKDKAVAEELLQDTYLRFMEYLPNYKHQYILSYLVTIGKRLAINEYHKRKKISYDNDVIDVIPNYDVSGFALVQSEKRILIDRALSVLTQEEKNVVLLYNIANLTHKEIAATLDKPIGTITWLYQKALAKMKEALKEVD
jgi:RNA polymerase sigma-70 factor (ECF subfamily)